MESNNTSRVLLGIFDSGVGGFSVAREVRKVSDANIIYYGDCARAPYGNREESEIISFIKDDITFLQDLDVMHFVNACNSMSVLTTNQMLKECGVKPWRYIDMIRAFDMHAFFPSDAVVLVIATVATIRSGVYQEVLKKRGLTVFEYAYEDLAQAVESNASRNNLLSIIRRSIAYAQEIGATHVVYGCTHYPMVHTFFLEVQESLKWEGNFVDPAVYVAEEIKKWKIGGERKFVPYSSKDTPAFISNVIKFL